MGFRFSRTARRPALCVVEIAAALLLASFLVTLRPLPAAAQPASDPASDPETGKAVAQIVSHVSKAYGGKEKLAEIPGYRAKGRILSITDGVTGTLRVAVALGGSMRVEIRYPDRNEIRILSGTLGWNGQEEHQEASTPAMLASMRLQFHRLAAPFEIVHAPEGTLETTGTSAEGWWRLRRTWSDKLSTTYEIDPESGLIRRIVGLMVEGGQELEFTTVSGDFRKVDGVPFPFRMSTLVGKEVTADTIFERITIVQEFEDGTFLPTGMTNDM